MAQTTGFSDPNNPLGLRQSPSDYYSGPTPQQQASAAAANTPLDPSAVNRWLDPSMQFQTDQGMRAINSRAGAGGHTFAGSTLRAIMDYSQNNARSDYQNAYQRAAGQQAFTQQGSQFDRNLIAQQQMAADQRAAAAAAANAQYQAQREALEGQNRQFDANLGYQRDTGNRAFDYQARLNDQTIPWQQRMDEARLGVQSAGQQGTLAATLAQLLGNNAIAAGNVQGTGTIGQNNAISDTISRILASMGQGNMMRTVFPSGG